MKIYTKTGDRGKTSLIGGTKVSKGHERIEAYGTVDELNAHVGLCRDLLNDEQTGKTMLEIQDRLFIIGSTLACDPSKETKMKLPELKESDVTSLETNIDRMNEVLPEMKNFILPGGHATVSQLHIARCICRRAERCCVRLQPAANGESADPEILIVKYLNRLSDYLFIVSRYIGHQLNVPEIPWRPN